MSSAYERLLTISLSLAGALFLLRWLWRDTTDTARLGDRGDGTTSKDKATHVRYYSFSTFNYDGSEAQSILHATGLAGDVLNFPMQGAGSYHMHGAWISDVAGAGGGQRTHRAEKAIEASGGQGFFSLGYGLTFLGLLRVYPFLGLGGGALNAKARYTEDAVTSLLDFSGPLFQSGIGLELLLGAQKGALLGVHLGYQFALGADVSRVPFMRLHIGGGQLRNQQQVQDEA